MFLRALIVWTLLCVPSFAQITTVVEQRCALYGIDSGEVVGNLLLVDPKFDTRLYPVAKVIVDTPAESVIVKASNKLRERVSVTQVDQKTFIVQGPGEIFVDIITINFTEKRTDSEELRLVIDAITPEPAPTPDPNPTPGPTPTPTPNPSIPDDRFDNLGKRVAGWANGLPKAKELAVLYQQAADALDSPQVVDVALVSNSIVTERARLLGTDAGKWQTFVKELNADFSPRYANMYRQDLQEYWRIIANALSK